MKIQFDKIEKYRNTKGFYATRKGDPFGMFFIPYKLKHILRIMATDGNDEFGWEHVSVSLPKRCPTWEEMCFVKSLFWSDDEVVIQIHPKKEDYVNQHNFCLHLWKNKNQEIITPPPILVGIKND